MVDDAVHAMISPATRCCEDEGRARCSPRDSSPRRRVVLLTVVSLVPIAVLATSSIVVASNEVTSVVNKQVQTTAAVSDADMELTCIVEGVEGVEGVGAALRQANLGLRGCDHACPGRRTGPLPV